MRQQQIYKNGHGGGGEGGVSPHFGELTGLVQDRTAPQSSPAQQADGLQNWLRGQQYVGTREIANRLAAVTGLGNNLVLVAAQRHFNLLAQRNEPMGAKVALEMLQPALHALRRI